MRTLRALREIILSHAELAEYLAGCWQTEKFENERNKNLFRRAARNKISSRKLFFLTYAREKFLVEFAQIKNPNLIPKNGQKKNFLQIKKT